MVNTIGDIARQEPADLRRWLGKAGEMLWTFANGYHNTPVTATGKETITIKQAGFA